MSRTGCSPHTVEALGSTFGGGEGNVTLSLKNGNIQLEIEFKDQDDGTFLS